MLPDNIKQQNGSKPTKRMIKPVWSSSKPRQTTTPTRHRKTRNIGSVARICNGVLPGGGCGARKNPFCQGGSSTKGLVNAVAQFLDTRRFCFAIVAKPKREGHTTSPYSFSLVTSDQHLVLKEITLRHSEEWTPQGNGWIVARVAEGCGYWLHDGTARELNPGDGFVIGGNVGGILRSSQLGPLKLQFFSVQPQYLNGLMSVAEWQRLEVESVSPLKRVSIFSATEPVSQKFLQIVDLPHNHGLWQRCTMLQIWSGALQDLLSAPVTEAAVGSKLNQLVRNLIGKMTGAELADVSLTDLAARVNCCTRQFSRLFRKEFGVTLHSRQIELRLQRAQQLLTDSDTKVRNIAYASGYRHLGLFNAMFKRRFGVTPSQWREQNGANNLSLQTRNRFSRLASE